MQADVGYLKHPMTISMLALWAVNDHILKAQFGNVWTGKLSDVAGLVVFPLFLLGLYETLVTIAQSKRVLMVCLLATGLFFVGLNTSQVISDLVCQLLGTLQWPFKLLLSAIEGRQLPSMVPTTATPDLTDLYTLPALWLSWSLGAKTLNARDLNARDHSMDA